MSNCYNGYMVNNNNNNLLIDKNRGFRVPAGGVRGELGV